MLKLRTSPTVSRRWRAERDEAKYATEQGGMTQTPTAAVLWRSMWPSIRIARTAGERSAGQIRYLRTLYERGSSSDAVAVRAC